MENRYDFQLDITKNDSHSLILRQIKKNTRVLEFGPGTGITTKYMKEELGCEVYIVEYDQNSYSASMKYAVDGVCGRIEEKEWIQKFSNIKFDYIVFMDVLEHVINPKEVLAYAKKFLKHEGRMFISTPNIAYSGVLAELYQNRFHYRKVGILDNTHVHFFSYFSLCELIETCGMKTVIYDATYNQIENTEFKESYYNIPGNYIEFFKNKSLGLVYQFVFTLVQNEYYENKKIEIINKIEAFDSSQKEIFKVYFDYGSDFTEDNAATYFYEIGKRSFDITLQIPKDVYRLRIDPIEGRTSIIRNLRIYSDQGKKMPFTSNGMEFENGIIFTTMDPQVLLEDIKDVTAIQISAEIYYIDIGNMPLIEELQGKIIDSENKIACIQEEKALAQNIMDKAVQEKRMIAEELDHYKMHYCVAINQREELKARLSEVEGAYASIANSFFWRVTKPLRGLCDTIKRLMKKNRYTFLVVKGIKCLKNNGVTVTWEKAKKVIFKGNDFKEINESFYLSEEKRQKEEKTLFAKDIKFSILVPLYNTPKNFLEEMILSVQNQTYKNWELCLADGSDEKHDYVKAICLKRAKEDKRIRYKKLEQNYGISGNTNQCIDMATGDYICLFDHDDILHPSVLYENMKVICEKDADFIYTDENTFIHTPADAYCPHFKPDYSPDTLRSYNYICHFTVFSKELQKKVGLFRAECDGSQDYDMILRLTEKAERIVHIPKILYYWRAHQNSVAADLQAKPYVIDAAKKALSEHLMRMGLKGVIEDSKVPSTYKVRYAIENTPLISILIPNKDHIDDLDKCMKAIFEKSTYNNFEIIIIENNSTQEETFAYYKEIERKENVRVVYWEGEFNYSAINNYGATYAKGEYILLLNNDIEVITPEWIEEMLMFAQRKDVGAVGNMLYYPDDTIQHAGVILGIGGVAGHSHKNYPKSSYGYMSRLSIAQNLSCVTAACLMIQKQKFDEINGLDESFKVAFNDVDFCMRLRRAGYLNIFTPYAEAYHYESKSRGYEDTPEKQERFRREVERFQSRWRKELEEGDPYYNPNLSLDKEDFSLR